MPEVIVYQGEMPNFQTWQLPRYNENGCGKRSVIFLKLIQDHDNDFGKVMG